MKSSDAHLTPLFEAAFAQYHQHAFREKDPVSFVHRYLEPEDQEIIGFLSAVLAYGNVRSILNNVDKAIAPLGEHPKNSIINENLSGKWEGFVHRFTQGIDIEILVHWIRGAILQSGSIEAFFSEGREKETKLALDSFVSRLFTLPLPDHLAEHAVRRQRNLKFLVSRPSDGSACKRLNMYLRWMVRKQDGIDLGLWSHLDPAQLMLPVDTHLLKTLRLLGWTTSSAANWKVVEQATANLRRLCPKDPIRYDFALCHLSMEGNALYLEKKNAS